MRTFQNIFDQISKMSMPQLLICYAIIGLFTSGWAYHHHNAIIAENKLRQEIIKNESCATPEQRLAQSASTCYGSDYDFDPTPAPMIGVIGGTFWPIYWVWSMFDLIPSSTDLKVVTVTKVEKIYVDSSPQEDSPSDQSSDDN